MNLQITYETLHALRRHLLEALRAEVYFVPMKCPPDWELLTKVTMTIECEEVTQAGPVNLTLIGELLQILGGNGLVFRLDESEKVRALFDRGPRDDEIEKGEFQDYQKVKVRISEASDICEAEKGVVFENERKRGGSPAGITPLSWSIEKLRAEWSNLSPAEKIRVARYGERNVRFIIIKGAEKQLHGHVLSNPKITPDEVAAMAAEAALDPQVLERIASGSEWTQHKAVVKNLIKNPKLPIPLVRRLLGGLGKRDLMQLRKSDRLRASVREMLSKKLAKF